MSVSDVVFAAVIAFSVTCCAGRSREQPGVSANGGVFANGGASANGGAGGLFTCMTDNDCNPNHCDSCRNTAAGCPMGICRQGQCFYDSCASVDACAGNNCGDTCQACYVPDAG